MYNNGGVLYISRHRKTLNAITALPKQADQFIAKLEATIPDRSNVVNSDPDSTERVPRMSRGGASKAGKYGAAAKIDNTITFGIGILNRKSSMRVGAGMRRKRTINLKGGLATGEVNRNSASYGESMTSLATGGPQSADEMGYGGD